MHSCPRHRTLPLPGCLSELPTKSSVAASKSCEGQRLLLTAYPRKRFPQRPTVSLCPVTFQADAMFRVHWAPLPPAAAQEFNEEQESLEGAGDTTTDTNASCRWYW